MVHCQQVHKTEPEPLTNTLPGRDGYDIEIFGMEGVPANAQAEWKARKEAELGTAATAAAVAANRPRQSYNVIPEADLMSALAQHKALMATRNNPAPRLPFMPFPPNFPPDLSSSGLSLGLSPQGMPFAPPNMSNSMPPGGFPGLRPGFLPPFPPSAGSLYGTASPDLPLSHNPGPFDVGPQNMTLSSSVDPRPSAYNPRTNKDTVATRNDAELQAVDTAVQLPQGGVIWPDVTASPAEKRALQPKYRYVSPSPEGNSDGIDGGMNRKRKAAADFI